MMWPIASECTAHHGDVESWAISECMVGNDHYLCCRECRERIPATQDDLEAHRRAIRARAAGPKIALFGDRE